MKSLRKLIQKPNNIWLFLVPLVALVVFYSLAIAQSVLPPMPSGPPPKAPINESPIAAPPTIGEIAAAIRLFQSRDYEGALALASKLADRGDTNAMALAGFLHERKLVKSANIVKAAEYYRRGSLMNNEDSMIGLGRLYIQPLSGVTIIEARAALEKALAKGRAEARIMLANILFFDETNPDKPRAFLIYKQEADSGNIEAAHLCALYLLDKDPQSNDDLIDAGEYLKIAAEGNIPQAQSLYGVYYYLGTVSARNLPIAADWFKKSAQNNDPDGMFYWALVNAKGEGVTRNLEIAREYAARAKDIDGDQQASALRLWQQLEQIRIQEQAKTAPPAKTKTAKRRKRR